MTKHVTEHVNVRQSRGARHRTCDGMSGLKTGGWQVRVSLGPFGKNCVWNCVDATRVRGRSCNCARNTHPIACSHRRIANGRHPRLVEQSSSCSSPPLHYCFAAGIRCCGIRIASVARVVGSQTWTNFRQTVEERTDGTRSTRMPRQ